MFHPERASGAVLSQKQARVVDRTEHKKLLREKRGMACVSGLQDQLGLDGCRERGSSVEIQAIGDVSCSVTQALKDN
jgi:hypothetical protein